MLVTQRCVSNGPWLLAVLLLLKKRFAVIDRA